MSSEELALIRAIYDEEVRFTDAATMRPKRATRDTLNSTFARVCLRSNGRTCSCG